MADVTVPDGWLPFVPLSWYRIPEYELDDDGKIAVDPRTRQPTLIRLTDRQRARPIGWIDNDDTGRVWVLA